MINLIDSWKFYLFSEFSKDYMIKLKKFLIEEKKHKIIYPENRVIFNAFNLTSINNVKVVILGQDPYSGYGQAHGLAFSVLSGVSIPPSLKNIYIELYNDLGIDVSKNGCLDAWAKQGVFLLNSILTVEKNKPLSHKDNGWEIFTDRVICLLDEVFGGIVFILWGKYAQNKCKYINLNKHFVLASSHPSPLSADKGFFYSRPFSKTNNYLKKIGKSEIDWRIF